MQTIFNSKVKETLYIEKLKNNKKIYKKNITKI